MNIFIVLSLCVVECIFFLYFAYERWDSYYEMTRAGFVAERPKKITVILIISIVPIMLFSFFCCLWGQHFEDTVFIKKFTISKELIEQVDSFDLNEETILKAIELNAKLSEKKVQSDCWYYIYWDNSIYDDVEFIKIKEGTNETKSEKK